MTPICSMCRREKHELCIGIGCQCDRTARCRENAEIQQDRQPGGDAA